MTSSLPVVERLLPGVRVFKRYGDGAALLECAHDPSQRRRLEGGEVCGSCFAGAGATEGWAQPVKILVRLDLAEPQEEQGSLF